MLKQPQREPGASKPEDSFRREISRWAEKVGAHPREVRIQRMTRSWASSSPRGRICFSMDLLGQGKRLQQAVIVHELLHLRIRNHGKLFKSLMNAYVPGWERLIRTEAQPCP